MIAKLSSCWRDVINEQVCATRPGGYDLLSREVCCWGRGGSWRLQMEVGGKLFCLWNCAAGVGWKFVFAAGCEWSVYLVVLLGYGWKLPFAPRCRMQQGIVSIELCCQCRVELGVCSRM